MEKTKSKGKIVKEYRNSSKVTCRKCGRNFVAMRGTLCYLEGLCHPCLEDQK